MKSACPLPWASISASHTEIQTLPVTEFNVRGEKLYLSPVLDLYNGEIVAYEMQETPRMPLVSEMLKKALGKLNSQEAPLLHSDQGWQYQMASYQRQLAA